MNSDSTLPPADTDPPVQSVSNMERLRGHLTPDGLALALLDAWKKDDLQAKALMLAAVHDFHKPR